MDEAFIKKIPPHDETAERSVIGSMIIDPDAITVASELLEADDFYQAKYGVVFQTIVDLNNQGKPVDLVILQAKLKEKEVSSELYELDFISSLINAVPTSANVRHYAQLVREKATLRRLIKVTEDIANNCYVDKEAADVLLDSTEKKIFDLLQKRDVKETEDIRDLVIKSLEGIEAASKHHGGVTGVATGFIDLDYKTAGMQPADLVLIAARPSMGKTAFVLNIAEHAALKSRVPTVIFSLEMSAVQITNRFLAMNARVDAQKMRTGNLSDADWANLHESAIALAEAPLIIDDTPGISISEMRSKCRQYKYEKGVGMIIIDYLQLMSAGHRVESREKEISEISRALKSLARELKCPVLACSQLSRAVEQRPDKRPMLSDLRESGAIEQDADVIMFIYRDEYYNKDREDNKGIAEIIIGKQRNGPTGTVTLKSQLEYTRFNNLQR